MKLINKKRIKLASVVLGVGLIPTMTMLSSCKDEEYEELKNYIYNNTNYVQDMKEYKQEKIDKILKDYQLGIINENENV